MRVWKLMQFEETNTRQNKNTKRGTSFFLKMENGEVLLSPRILLLKCTGYQRVFFSQVQAGKKQKGHNEVWQDFSITSQCLSDKLVVSAGLDLCLWSPQPKGASAGADLVGPPCFSAHGTIPYLPEALFKLVGIAWAVTLFPANVWGSQGEERHSTSHEKCTTEHWVILPTLALLISVQAPYIPPVHDIWFFVYAFRL